MKSFRSFSKLKVFSPRSISGVRSLSGKWTKQKEGSPPGVITSTRDFTPVTDLTLPESVFQGLHKWENAPAMRCGLTGRVYTFKQIYECSRSFGVALKNAGFKRHDTVCILLPNMPEYPIIAFGAMQAGCVVSIMNPAYTQEELARQINDCRAKVVVTIPQLAPLIDAIRPSCPLLTEKTIQVSGDAIEGCHSFFEMIKTPTTGVDLLTSRDMDCLNDTAILPYSSGTTGNPKGVELTHAALTSNIKMILSEGYCQTAPFEGGHEQERYLCILPFFHIYGFHLIMSAALQHGNCITTLPKFEPQSYIKCLSEVKPTLLHLVTPIVNFLANHPQVPASILSELRGVAIGAAPLGKELINRFLGKFGDHIFLQEGYGMSESPVTHFIPKEIHNGMPGSCGVAIPGTVFKIVDLDTGKILGENQSGEVCLQGPMIMKGYLNNEKATRETIDQEKFLHTGDIGYYDSEGFLYIEDRLKDLIKVKGLQVAPSELEDVLRKHPEIGDVAVIGVPHDRNGEAPRAYIVRKNEKLSEEDIHEFLKPQLATHKQLSGGIEFMTEGEIPKAVSGKILKRMLVAHYNNKTKK